MSRQVPQSRTDSCLVAATLSISDPLTSSGEHNMFYCDGKPPAKDHKPANFGQAGSEAGTLELNSCPRLKMFCLEFNILEQVKGPSTNCHQERNQMWRRARSESS